MKVGIRESKLLANLLEGKESRVPVGKTIITNNAHEITKGIMPRTAGHPLTTLHIDQFDAFGSSKQQKAAKRDDQVSDVAYVEREVINDGLIVEAAFDDSGGLINMVKKNSQILVIDGLLTQADFGTGATGPKGDHGFDAYDGFDGDEGADGATGCAGPEGAEGQPGPRGASNADGAQGIPGHIGQQGPEGIQGQVGDMGRFGHEGARGRPGSVCETELGAAGVPGAAANSNVVISPTEPDNLTVLWGLPD